MVRQEEGSRRDKMEMQAELREQHGKVETHLGTIKDVATATYKIAENLRFKASSFRSQTPYIINDCAYLGGF